MTSKLPRDLDWQSVELEEAINWNRVDPYELEVWNRLVGNFWTPERIPLANDLQSWSTFTPLEKEMTSHVFAGLTLLDTIQARFGSLSLIPDARTPHEEAIYRQIAHMEDIHAKSYSSIFSTLLSTREIDEEFAWSRDNEFLKKKAAIILYYYKGEDPEKRKIASTMLESFLFYSGFFMPFYWSSHSKLTNTADVIGLIQRDEAIHGTFIASRFQVAYREASADRQAELKQFTTDLFEALYENELHYTESIYDNLPSGVTEQAKTFLQYNANRAFQNLGFDEPFAELEVSSIAHILGLISQAAETHDFFSGVGSSYVIGGSRKQESTDEDWDF